LTFSSFLKFIKGKECLIHYIIIHPDYLSVLKSLNSFIRIIICYNIFYEIIAVRIASSLECIDRNDMIIVVILFLDCLFSFYLRSERILENYFRDRKLINAKLSLRVILSAWYLTIALILLITTDCRRRWWKSVHFNFLNSLWSTIIIIDNSEILHPCIGTAVASRVLRNLIDLCFFEDHLLISIRFRIIILIFFLHYSWCFPILLLTLLLLIIRKHKRSILNNALLLNKLGRSRYWDTLSHSIFFKHNRLLAIRSFFVGRIPSRLLNF